MADPKYANLPGIDLDQPDVYETSDLPEDDQNQIAEEEVPANEALENLKLNAADAYAKFRGTTLDSTGIDFSERVSLTRRTGYFVPQTEYEILGESSKIPENPQQKYQRLQHEIRQLVEDVNQVKDAAKADSSAEKLAPVPMLTQVEYLQQQLTDLHLDEVLGSKGSFDLSDPQGALQKRLLSELEAFKTPTCKAGEKTHPPSAADYVTYQLYYKPEQAKFSHNARMAEIEQRMERLEAVIGNNPEKLSALTSETNNKCILGAVSVLSSRTSLLDPSQLEQVEGRLTSLVHKLGQIVEKKDAVEDADQNNKISELYDLVRKWDAVADTLPLVVDRLAALKELHEQALQFSQALTHLDVAQQQIQGHLHSHGDMLKQVKTTLETNVTAIKANFENLDKRLQIASK